MVSNVHSSLRLAVLAPCLGVVVLALASLACGPAAPPGQGGGGSDSTPKPTVEPTPTPRPTVCATKIDDDGRQEMCFTMPRRDKDEDNKLDPVLRRMAEEAEEQARTGVRSAVVETVHVRVDTASNDDMTTITGWLDERNISYEAFSSSGRVYAYVRATLLPDLAALDGVVRVRKQYPPNLP